MTIFIIGAKTIEGQPITAGTEIGAFGKSDPNRCVGASVLTGAVNPSNPVQVIASKNDGENGGFIDGDSIIFKLWDTGLQREHIVKPYELLFFEPENGNPTMPMLFQGLGTTAIDITLTTTIDVRLGKSAQEPMGYVLMHNYPNPFNPSTVISYTLPVMSNIVIEIYNINGELVKRLFEGTQDAGIHSQVWDAKNVTSGIYFCKLKLPKEIQTVKMLLSK